jgi:hypothetical protein
MTLMAMEPLLLLHIDTETCRHMRASMEEYRQNESKSFLTRSSKQV